MPALLTILLAVAADAPRVALVSGEHRLILSQPMRAALLKWDASFQPWRDRDYLPSIIRDYKYACWKAPFVIIGDYNGDGRPDIAIAGHTKNSTLLIVLLSGASEYRVVELSRGKGVVDPKTIWYGMNDDRKEYGFWVFFSELLPGGTDLGVVDAKPLELKHDAFMIEYWEKGSSAYYWNGNRFAKVTTGD